MIYGKLRGHSCRGCEIHTLTLGRFSMRSFARAIAVLATLLLVAVPSSKAVGCWLCRRCNTVVVGSGSGGSAAVVAGSATMVRRPVLSGVVRFVRSPFFRGAVQLAAEDAESLLNNGGSVNVQSLVEAAIKNLVAQGVLTGPNGSTTPPGNTKAGPGTVNSPPVAPAPVPSPNLTSLANDVKQLKANVEQLQKDVNAPPACS